MLQRYLMGTQPIRRIHIAATILTYVKSGEGLYPTEQGVQATRRRTPFARPLL